jgi:3-hydroxyacyl-CoA dehydrogenase/3-hydroxy-2-methylbutyryl-CoA dehydrogenase
VAPPAPPAPDARWWQTNKTYLVTGGASGLGEASARRLAALGANVALLDRDVARGQALAKELGSKTIFVEMDATKEESVKAAVDASMKKFGNIWGAVNCAGVGGATLTVDKKGAPHPTEVWDFVLKVNLFGTFNCCKYAAAYMTKNQPDENGLRGVLINVASVAALEGQKGQVAYAASKGAVTQMTLPMARDLGQFGIRVLTICPGIFDTPLMAAASDPVKKGLAESVVAPKRLGNPSEFGLLVTQLVENSYMNGEVIRLDGAIRMGYSSKI